MSRKKATSASRRPCIYPNINEVLPADGNHILLPDRQPTPVLCTDKGKAKEVSHVEIKNTVKLCALNWQNNGHQKQPASVFVLYWNSLAATAKEDYKRKATAQLSSTSTLVQASSLADDASNCDS
ncbi:hypothetical protein BDR05DRAFT_1013609 [Suillus weaverae]|nr:hypothetical protein BDR05DRAFT_1013609 [Suillus weaverae]